MRRSNGRHFAVAGTLMLAALSGPVAAEARKAPVLDLSVATVVATPTAVTVGESFSVSFAVRNSGSKALPKSRTRLYLSRDGKADAKDLALKTIATPAIKRGRTHRATSRVSTPASFATGEYRLIACADSSRRVRE